MRLAARTDRNQQAIVDTLRAAGRTVQVLSAVGQGCPDLLVGRADCNYLLECKVDKAKLTADELNWHLLWRGRVHVVRSPDEALQATQG